MKRILAIAVLTAVLVSAALLTQAQEEAPRPEFDNAPVTDVLLWAQRSVGVGFIYDGAVLREGGDGPLRRITASHVQPETRAERTLLLFELLRRCGLVAFEVGGMPGPTYQLYTADGARRHAPLLHHPDEIGDMLFAGLAIRLRRALAPEVAARIRNHLTPRVGTVEVFEMTQTLIVADFADRLRVAHEVALAAEEAAMRDDDNLVADFALKTIPVGRALAALERLREPGEEWKAALHETANVLLVSGRRDELDRLGDRVRRIDRHEAHPEFAESTWTIRLTFLEPGQAVRVLREMLDARVKAGLVQLSAFDRDRAVVIRGSKADYESVRETLRVLDVQRE